MEDVYFEAKKKVKAIQNLNKHSTSELLSWVVEAMDTRYPASRKKAFEIVIKRRWNDIKAEIIQIVQSQNFEELHKLRDSMLKADLLLNKELLKNGLIVDGTLAVITNTSNVGLFIVVGMISENTKDAKLETYLLYRYFAGKPRLSNGFGRSFNFFS